MVWLSTVLDWVLHPIRTYKEKKALREKLEELRKRDPFIYK